jgi:NADH dehydrogenase FAD-containing subunit
MSTARPYRHLPLRVLVVGGGVAGLEACFALDALAGDRVHVTLIAPNAYLMYRPVEAHDPLALDGRVRVPLAHLARAAHADLRLDRVVAFEPGARRVHTARGYELGYDALVVAVGARPEPVPPGAASLREENWPGCRILRYQLARGELSSLAFVEPPAPCKAFDLYDLAIQAAVMVRRNRVAADLTFVTAQSAPLAFLGVRAASMLASTLGAHGLRVVESAYVRSARGGEVHLAPGPRRIAADAVIAAPRLGGPWLDNLPRDRNGFLPTDAYGGVPGLPEVYAVGDCTPFPVRHPSLAAQQADVVAAMIAAVSGRAVAPERFTPVLRGVLPSQLRWYVEAPLTGGRGDATEVSAFPLWQPALRFHARFLGQSLDRTVETTHPVRQSDRMARTRRGSSVGSWPSRPPHPRAPRPHRSDESTTSRTPTFSTPAERAPISAS